MDMQTADVDATEIKQAWRSTICLGMNERIPAKQTRTKAL